MQWGSELCERERHFVRPAGGSALPPVRVCCYVRWLVRVLLVRDCRTQLDQGQAKLVRGSKGPALLDKENISWQMSVLSVFFFHAALCCCGLFRSPCHGKCGGSDGTAQTARLGEAAALSCIFLFRGLSANRDVVQFHSFCGTLQFLCAK